MENGKEKGRKGGKEEEREREGGREGKPFKGLMSPHSHLQQGKLRQRM